MDISEKKFEQEIEKFLLSAEGGYTQFYGQDENGAWVKTREHNIDRCIYMDVLIEFIEATQPKEWEKYKRNNGKDAADRLYTRLQTAISKHGLLHVLRNGISEIGGSTFRLCYFKPESSLNNIAVSRYKANIFGCTRQFRYSTKNNNTIDMVLSLNGIPLVALELKNQFTGQNYASAINQYKKDRSSKEFAFRLNNRFLAYFAVDLSEAWLCTELKDGESRFLPFNQGSNGAGVTGGAGNPPNPNGYATSYLWERVLKSDSLLDLVHRFISCVKVKEEVEKKGGKVASEAKSRIVFPRYHQYDVVHKVLADVKKNGAGKNYLIQHSAGSGKSNSIAWIAYRLASAHDKNDKPIFDSVIVVTNLIVLDSQLQDTINSFDHQVGLVEAIDESKNSRSLAAALNDNRRIVICTIQKFLYAEEIVNKFKNKKFAIIVDEAHQGQSGECAQALKKVLVDIDRVKEELADVYDPDKLEDIDFEDLYIRTLIGQGKHKNQSFFAFTATPKAKTIENFGVEVGIGEKGDVLRAPFHVYSMRQAIEEGYILDVLSHYMTMKESFKLVKTTNENPMVLDGRASKALVDYYKKHGHTIEQKTDVIMSNFLENCRYQIGGRGKAMVVASSRQNAVRYYYAIKDYIEKHKEECVGTDVMVAFSGEVTLNDRSDKTFREETMNVDENGKYITSDKMFRKVFHSDKYNILVVANKYQTGFDEPLLHTMYVDKKLKDVVAVQTLSRLNRTMPGKTGTFVIDFENDSTSIKEAFRPYYETTMMEGETDLNKIYDIRVNINDCMLYNYESIDKYYELMSVNHRKQTQEESTMAKLKNIIDPVIDNYNKRDKDDRFMVRDLLNRFVKAYSYITQLVRVNDEELFKEYLFVQNILKFLPNVTIEDVNVEKLVKLEYATLKKTFDGAIMIHEKSEPVKPKNGTGPRGIDDTESPLQTIIDKVNERFKDDFTDSDRVVIKHIYDKFMNDKEVVQFKKYAKSNNVKMFVESLFPDKFQKIITECYKDNRDSFDKLYYDKEFYEKVMDAMARAIYNTFNNEK